MNKIYRVIWSKVKNCYVVVSEIAKAHSKGGSTVRRVPRMGAILTTMLLASFLTTGYSIPVWAADPVIIEAGDTIQAGNGIVFTVAALEGGEGSNIITVSAEEDETLGFLKKYMKFNATYPDSNPDSPDPVSVVDARSKSSFALGEGTIISLIPGDDKSSVDNLAIGSSAKVYGNTAGSNTAIGANAVVGYFNSYYSNTDGIFTKLSTALGASARVYGDQGVAIGENAQVGKSKPIIIAGKQTYDAVSRGVAIGSNAKAWSDSSTAIGPSAEAGTTFKEDFDYAKRDVAESASTSEATSVGYLAKALDNSSTAVGARATASDKNSTAIGVKAQAEEKSTAIGVSSKATSLKSLAIGEEAEASGQNSIAIGTVIGNTVDNKTKIIAKGQNSTAIGASAQANSQNSTAIGANTKANNTNSTAIGSAAKAFGQQSSAIGASTVATGKQNVAIGIGSEARKYETMALGFHAVAVHSESIAVGHDTAASGDSSLAIGHLAITGMPAKEGYHEATDTKYFMLPTNSKLSGDSKLYFQTSDGTVLLQESNSTTNGETEGTYYKVKAFPVDSEGNLAVDNQGNPVSGDQGNIADWRFEKVDADGKPVLKTGKAAVKYKSSQSTNKDIRDPQFANDKVNHIDYYYEIDKNNKEVEGTRTNPLDGGIAIGSYTVAQGEHSLAVGLTSAAYGKNSTAHGLYASAFGEGAIAFGHETVSGAHVTIKKNANIEDAHTTEFWVSKVGITPRTLVDGSVVGVDKNSVYKIDSSDDDPAAVEVNSTGTILTVNNNKFGFDKNKISLASDSSKAVSRDDATGNYYYTDENGKKVQVGSDEEITFADSDNGSIHVTIPAGKMTLSSGGISFGSYSHAEGDRSMALGRAAGAYDKNSTAIGLFANAFGEGAMAIGHNTVAGAEIEEDGQGRSILKLSDAGTGIPVRNPAVPGVNVKGGIAIGSFAHALGDRAISVGRNSGAFGNNSTVFGLESNAYGQDSMAFGHEAVVGDKEDAATKGQNSIAIGRKAEVTGSNSIAIGTINGTVDNTDDSEQANVRTKVSGDHSIAIGAGSEVTGENSIAIGTGHTVSGSNSGAFGDPNVVNAISSYIVGNESAIDGDNTDAITVTNAFVIGNSSSVDNTGGLVFGSGSSVTAENGLALGNNASVSAAGGVALGNGSVAARELSEGGYNPATEETNYTDGTGAWESSAAAVSVGGGTVNNKTVTRQITNVAAGSELTDAVNVAQLRKIAADMTHFYSVNSSDETAGNYDNKGATGTNALAAGVNAKAAGDYSAAVGNGANAKADNSIAIGNGAKAKEEDAIAIGTGATAKGVGSIALGRAGAKSVGWDAMAWGVNTKAKGDESTAWGTYSKAKGDGSTAFGFETIAKGDYSTAWGLQSKATGESATAWGSNARAKGDSSTAWGDETRAVGTNATAWGVQTKAKGFSSTAFGYYTKATGEMATVWGSLTYAAGNSSTAFGERSAAYGGNSLAALGGTTGSDAEDGNAVSSVAVGKNAVAFKDHTYAIGQDAEARGDNTIALGNSVVAEGKNAVAIGSGDITRQIGTLTEVDRPRQPTEYSFTDGSGTSRTIQEDETGQLYYENDSGTKIYLDKNDVLSREDNRDDDEAEDLITTTTYLITEAKNPAQASGDNSIAVGMSASASGNDGIAIGTGSGASEEGAIAFGNNASATKAHSVALGSKSSTTEIGGMKTLEINGKTYKFAGTPSENNGTVSIGSAGKERTILNVAPGRISDASTDAINGSQLYSAIDAMQFTIKAGDNVDVKTTVDDNGHTVYTIHALNAIVEAGPSGNVTVDPEPGDGNGADGQTAGTGAGTEGEGAVTPAANDHTTTYIVDAIDTTLVPSETGLALSDTELSLTVEDTAKNKVTGAVKLSDLQKQIDTNTLYTLSGVPGETAADGSTEYTVTLTGSDDTTSTATIVDTNTTYTIKAKAGEKDSNVVNEYTVTGSDGKDLEQKIVDTDTQYTLSGEGKTAENGSTTYTISLKDNNGGEAQTAEVIDTNTKYELSGEKGETTDNHTKYSISLKGTDGSEKPFEFMDTRNTVKAGDDSIDVETTPNEDGSVTYTLTAKAKASSNVEVKAGSDNIIVTPPDPGDDPKIYTVDVKTDGKVASGDTGIVTGDTVYRETRVEKDGNYIKKDYTAAENITALDEQVKTNADNIDNINNQFNDTYNQISRLDDRMKKGLAGAAALAALHPMDFDPDSKLTFAAGVGNYRGANAGAIGAFYRPDEKIMFSMGGTFGNGENMVNAGVSFALDRVNRVTTSRVAMAKEIVELRDHIAKQDEQIAKQDEQIAKLTELVNKLAGTEQQKSGEDSGKAAAK